MNSVASEAITSLSDHEIFKALMENVGEAVFIIEPDTLRILLATTIAGIPCLIFRPEGKVLLVVFGILFLVLSAFLLTVIRPLSKKDLDMIGEVRPAVVKYLKWFARSV